MTEHDAFLQEIIAKRDDDAPRLMYADWLMERGDPRGEYIRVQCELTRAEKDKWREHVSLTTNQWSEVHSKRLRQRERERELLIANWHRWYSTFIHGTTNGCVGVTKKEGVDVWHEFRRGFVAHVTLTAESWLKHADALLKAAPIEEVTLTTWPSYAWAIENAQWASISPDEKPLALDALECKWPRIKFNLPN